MLYCTLGQDQIVLLNMEVRRLRMSTCFCLESSNPASTPFIRSMTLANWAHASGSTSALSLENIWDWYSCWDLLWAMSHCSPLLSSVSTSMNGSQTIGWAHKANDPCTGWIPEDNPQPIRHALGRYFFLVYQAIRTAYDISKTLAFP